MLEQPQITIVDAQPTAVVKDTVAMAQIREFYDRAFPAAVQAATRQQVGIIAAFGLYLSTPAETVDLEVGFITDGQITAEDDVVPSELPAGDVVRAVHVGGYEGLGESWRELYAWVVEQGRQVGPMMWEVYETEPGPDVDPATMRTVLYWPLV
ncbi:GyrI-like domain-containing protein [Propionibacteriaceae bacterium G1746]|uniref:GyrI-like domain-containing protein n=1 Tax=Aestuariimicrobium sp. G57 TaxID=3418485 RepID=UPI003C228A8C